ncbi:MAG: hypothetical protein GW946_03945 [Candidatus Pacebacteria bacterium]|nr:hypothetical protein [Candidatus Paceibacterota bacterium]PIR60909.1 MAG: hypothetical protein COU67_00425 [Candidatus Pacebacteria bacterium CG10_big_fil_rev_8_21_14_0_10_44_54]
MTLRNSLLLTLSYSAQFSYPLRVSQLWLRLLTVPHQRFSKKLFVQEILVLVGRKKIIYQDGYLFFPGYERDIALRIARERRAEQKQSQIKKVVWLCKKIPWIVGLAVTGSVALRQAREQDDLDFLVVTKHNSLWLARSLLVGFGILLGMYRSRNNAHTDGWCFNMWLERPRFVLSPERRSLYTAYEVLQADWVYDQGAVQREFLLANAWVSQVLPTFYVQKFSACSVAAKIKIFASIGSLLSPIGSLLNVLAFILQRWHMHAAMTREVVVFSQAYFHPRNTQQYVTKRWRELLQEIA